MSLKIRVGLMAALSVGFVLTAAAAAPDPCNRACLKDLAHSYVAALVAHDPTPIRLRAATRPFSHGVSDTRWRSTWTGSATIRSRIVR